MSRFLSCLAGAPVLVLLMGMLQTGTCHPLSAGEVDCSPESGQILLPNPYNCGQFYHCSHGRAVLRACPVGLYFNPFTLNCDWPVNVDSSLCSLRRAIPQDVNTTVGEGVAYVRKLGRLSSHADQASSTAVCAEGTVPVDCACSVPGQCGGAYITNRNCVVYNGGSSSGQQAIATCLAELTTSEFRWVDSGQSWDRYPRVTCPQSYHVIKCLLSNPWSKVRFVHSRINLAENRCESDGACSFGQGCGVQAVCRIDAED